MMKHIILVAFTIAQTLSAFTIRSIEMADVPSALALDETICSEYFKPMFVDYYSHTPLGKDPDYYLGLDIANDKKLFPDCAQNIGNEKLLVAIDDAQKKVVGLIVVHKEDDSLAEIDLLLVDQKYRGQGIGKRLMQEALAPFNGVKQHGVYVFSHNYKALDFYKKLGFSIVGPGPEDRKTAYGLSFAQLYVYCKRTLGS